MFLLSLTPTCRDQSHWKIIIEEDKASRYSESILVHQSQSQAINLTSEYVQEKAFYVGFDVIKRCDDVTKSEIFIER